MSRSVAVQFGKVSLVTSMRAGAAVLVLAALVISVSLVSINIGSYPLSAEQMTGILLGGGNDIERMIMLDHRLPRILCAIAAGAAFGLSGAMFQTMLRNPLASPDVIGFTAGASLGALIVTVLFGSGFIVFGAMGGGLFAALLVMGLSWNNGIQPYRLILVGIGFGLAINACADLLMSRIDVLTAADMAKWLVGTLNARNCFDVQLGWTGLLVLGPIALMLQFPLSRLSMSDDLVTGLGLRLSLLRTLISVTAVGLVAFAISVAGPLPFVAFVSGPIARGLVGGGRPALLCAALTGALVTLVSDLAGRALIDGVQLPAGVFTAVIGAPVLMWLLMVQFRKGPR